MKLSDHKSLLFEIANRKHIEYIPTGLQEDIIHSVGCGKYNIIVVLDANRVGKTTTLINIAKNIIWDYNPEWFGWWEGESVFEKWPFSCKRFRITGTPTNLSDEGIIQQSIEQWWPVGRYERDKVGKHYYSIIKTDTGWTGDCLTYEQSPKEYEGQTLSLVLSDEPPKHQLIGAITSRMAEGGIWVITMTPIDCGYFLDEIDDLKDRGARVKVITGTAFENSITSGKPNHKGTKRGLWTDDQIHQYVATIPLHERDARVYGKGSKKSGKIFPMYDSTIHQLPKCRFDITSGILAKCNCFMSIDPHDRYYPAIQWHAITPPHLIAPGPKHVIYNEWPLYGDNHQYYSDMRKTVLFNLTLQELAQIIQIMDCTIYGAGEIKRIIDPRWSAQNPQYLQSMVAGGVTGWQSPIFERIESGRILIQESLKMNEAIGFLLGISEPEMYVCEHCKNTDRALSRHHWSEKDRVSTNDGVEDETFKDFIDTIRNFRALVPEIVYRKQEREEKEIEYNENILRSADIVKMMKPAGIR